MKEIFKGIAFVFFVLAIVIVICAGSNALAASKKKVYEVTFMSVYPKLHSAMVTTTTFLDMVEESTNGRIKFKRYYSSQLAPARQALDATGKGIVDILYSYAPYYAGKVATGVMGFPGGWPNPTSWVYNFHNDPELRELISKQYRERINVVLPLMHGLIPASCFIMVPGKEIRKIEDFKGKTLRSPGGAVSDVLKELGAATITLIGGEWYTAMQRGTVDGVMGYSYALRSYKLIEVAGSITRYPMVETTCPQLFVNADFWKNLPDDLKEAIIQVDKKWSWEVNLPVITKLELDEWQAAKDKGVEIISLPKEDVEKIHEIAFRTGRENYLKLCRSQGYGEVGQKIMNKMIKAREEWPELEKKLLKEGKIKKGEYMYPSN